MKICFPACKHGGKRYASAEEIMGLIGREPHGSWLAGTNQLWHGGLHISTVSAPGSVLTADDAGTAVPLPCMADGEVVVWRVNKAYLTNTYNENTVQYSSTFLLVKSVCQPNPKDASSWLEFYSLYMGLAPLSAFPKHPRYRVTAQGDGVRQRHYNGQETTGQPVPGATGDKLGSGDQVLILRRETFLLQGESEPFGLAQPLKDGKPQGAKCWVSLRDGYLAEDGDEYGNLPDWMRQSVAQGTFDEVVTPAEPLHIAAGDAVGFLAEDIAPTGKSRVDTSYFAHVEIISVDARMPDFLNNPAGVTTGQQYVQIPSGASLYQRSGEGKDSTFNAMSCIVLKDGGKILPREACHPLTDKDGKTWFEVSPHSWISQDEVKELHQYDLKERGFTALEEESTSDVSKTLREGWVKQACDWFSERVNQNRGIQETQVSRFYKNLVKKIDTDGNGELSGRELYNAVHHPEMGIRDIAARLVVKHDSEWFGGSSHHRWNVFFQNYDRLRINYAKKWLDDCEWMSQVVAFSEDQPIWHMHPVMFLEAIKPPIKREKVTGKEFVKFVLEQARDNEVISKVPAAITTAQAILETGYGKSVPVDIYNGEYSYNLFGIKAHGNPSFVSVNTHEYINGVKTAMVDKFMKYDSYESSISGRAAFFVSNRRYHFLFDYSDPKDWARGLQQAGYATDPQYANKLISIMSREGLL